MSNKRKRTLIEELAEITKNAEDAFDAAEKERQRQQKIEDEQFCHAMDNLLADDSHLVNAVRKEAKSCAIARKRQLPVAFGIDEEEECAYVGKTFRAEDCYASVPFEKKVCRTKATQEHIRQRWRTALECPDLLIDDGLTSLVRFTLKW